MGWMNDPIADSPSPTNANGDVSSFVQQYGPMADKISEKLGVSSDLILGKLGLETAWGKKVIPGTNNLGNIKDVSGRGVKATDNYSGSRDAYLQFEDPETFGNYYADFIQRLYPNAVGAGGDVKKFAAGLATGKNGSYAEDPNYGTKVAGASQMVAKARGGSQGGWMNDPTTSTEPVTVVQPKEEPKKEEAPAPAKRSTAEELVRQGGLTARYGLQGAEKAFTFPVRAVFEAVGTGAEMLGAKDTGKYIRDNLGMGGNAGRQIADAVSLPKPETKLEKFVGGASETVAGLGVGGAAQKVAENAPAAIKNTVNALMPTANTGKEAALYTAIGGSMDVAPVETAAVLALATAGKAGYDRAKLNSAAEKLIKNAGDNAGARLDAEIITDLSRIAGNKNLRGNNVQAVQLNALENKYITDVNSALKDLGKEGAKKLGVNQADIQAALQARRIITPDELNALRGNPAGNAVADAIEKAQRARSLTAAVPASQNIVARVGRTALDVAPIPQPVRYLGQRILGSRQTREDVASKLLTPRNVEAAGVVQNRLGPSAATESLGTLQDLAQKAQTASKARAAQEQAAKVQRMADQAKTKNEVLAQSKMPLGGGFQELLPGGASGLNLSSDDAIKALRIVSKMDKNSAVSKAAGEILKSGTVKDSNAFYGVQNTIRRLSEEGKIAGGQTSQGVLSSGIRNPVSYKANVENAMDALKVARDAAPNKALSQFASTVAGTKAPSEKLKLVEDRLAKATDPAEIDFLNNFVKPLTKFGKKEPTLDVKVDSWHN